VIVRQIERPLLHLPLTDFVIRPHISLHPSVDSPSTGTVHPESASQVPPTPSAIVCVPPPSMLYRWKYSSVSLELLPPPLDSEILSHESSQVLIVSRQ
jgi:hypothetical protein